MHSTSLIIIIIIIIQFLFINVSRQQPDGQLQKQHNIEKYIVKGNKQGTCETYTHTRTHTHTTNGRELKLLISIPHNTKLTLKTDSVTICLFKTPQSLQTDRLTHLC